MIFKQISKDHSRTEEFQHEGPTRTNKRVRFAGNFNILYCISIINNISKLLSVAFIDNDMIFVLIAYEYAYSNIDMIATHTYTGDLNEPVHGPVPEQFTNCGSLMQESQTDHGSWQCCSSVAIESDLTTHPIEDSEGLQVDHQRQQAKKRDHTIKL